MFKNLNPFFVLIIVCVIIVEGDKESAILYDASDPIVILDYTNFETAVNNRSTAWFVEYYFHWCGHCQRFAPTFKSFSSNINDWSDIVQVGVINCADEKNSDPCNGVRPVPAIKYFSLGEVTGKKINMSSHSTEVEIRQRLIDELHKDHQSGQRSYWPDIAPYSGDASEDWEEVLPPPVNYQLFLFEGNNSYLGTEVILDLHKMTSLQIRRVTNDNEPLQRKYDVTTFPALVVLDRAGRVIPVELLDSTREGITKVIKDFMRSQGLISALGQPTDPKIQVQSNNEVSPAESKHSESIKKSFQDGLYQADLERALKYSLIQEISLTDEFTNDKLQALTIYLEVLANYFPLRKGNSEFLIRLHEIVANETSLTGEIFKNIVTKLQQELSPVFMEDREWTGCKGSAPRFRGFPCGLWTLFHTLTVSYAKDVGDEANPSGVESPSIILGAMYGYIKNFFGCSDCASHFVDMANRRNYSAVMTPDDAILWLWEAHNEVNQRLSSDYTEDPVYPKIQYPSWKHCNTCRHGNASWNLQEVLHYLKNKYSRIILSNQPVLPESNEFKFQALD
uniref:Sulfhydryl oxidase n=2 Tax=Fopius arisanus TaxID=64838 RepID=A0A0C9PXU2_9HYME